MGERPQATHARVTPCLEAEIPSLVETIALKMRESLSVKEGRDINHPLPGPSLADEETPAQRGEALFA